MVTGSGKLRESHSRVISQGASAYVKLSSDTIQREANSKFRTMRSMGSPISLAKQEQHQ